MPKTNKLIVVENVKKHFKKVKAVNGISLQIGEGEFVALLGPNGAGKTTLVEMIEGIQKPDSGTIFIDNKTWNRHRTELHKLLGISLQETRFFDKLTVGETLKLFSSFYKLDFSRIDEIIKLVNLQEKKRSFIKNLSGGQRQKLALGIAILNRPKILLLDEPTTGLDPTARREIWNILLKLRTEQNTSLVLTTHYMEEAEFLCDRIIIMDNGKILAKGTLEDLLSEYNYNEVIEFKLKNGYKIEMENLILNKRTGKYKLPVKKIVDDLPVFLDKIAETKQELELLECRKMTLDDLFITMTGRHLSE